MNARADSLATGFQSRARGAVGDAHLRKSFRGAMDFLANKRALQFPDDADFQALRAQGEAIRRYSLSRLPDLLEQLETRLQQNGVQVHWAENAAEAQAIVVDIARRADADLVVKGKSMVSEEVGINHALADAGIEALETDMGEYIVQLAGEAPSHIIMPAIHKTKEEIARLFAEKIPGVDYTDSVDELIQIGRRVLRDRFGSAKVGLSGVNVAVAETGTPCLVENEGNGRMCTTVPDIHIAITGIEKIVEKIEHVAPLMTLLTRSATGQPVTTYFNWISGPRKPGELDGPREVHLVLVDNGRSQAYATEAFRATLQCIRCGACMNHCPVYARIGGHAYGTTYPGPIGAVISPHLLGLAATYPLVTASTLCGACAEVCPVGVPIPDLLLRLRTQAQGQGDGPRLRGAGSGRNRIAGAAFWLWSRTQSIPALYRLVGRLAGRLRFLTPARQGAWTLSRTPLIPAPRSLHEAMEKHEHRASLRFSATHGGTKSD